MKHYFSFVLCAMSLTNCVLANPNSSDAGNASSDADGSADASIDVMVPDLYPCQGQGACGVITAANGMTFDCGGCPTGQVCGDNGQPNVCGSACVPAAQPTTCNDYLNLNGYQPGQLLQYSTYCTTDPPIDQNNCIIWQSMQDCNDEVCPYAYCCLPPYIGEGADASAGATSNEDAAATGQIP
jgi:hypothetical protein